MQEDCNAPLFPEISAHNHSAVLDVASELEDPHASFSEVPASARILLLHSRQIASNASGFVAFKK
jgi:hypothetical protein